jgi:wyosine [tRNA(Phe)-imidazoG37] synthetase (radical SAM superfamily)
MKMQARQYLFGPVPSRRFGWSLGVDLTPIKTCTLDCVFCQLGRTTVQTLERREYAPTRAVTRELAEWIRDGGEADYITLAGSGEPTLHRRFGEIIDFVHERSSIPVALLTNGTTLGDPEVRSAACRADVVKVTLSAWDEASFARLHRPCSGVTFRGLVEGERQLRRERKGAIWMEVFFVGGLNSSSSQARRIAEIARRIEPDRVQLNSCVRPSAEGSVARVSEARMSELAGLFTPHAETLGASCAGESATARTNATAIESMLRRRPCTAADVAAASGMHPNEVSKYLGRLTRAGRIRARRRDRETYYLACGRTESNHADV